MTTTTMYGGASQDDVAQQRRLAQQLMTSGMSTEPVQHWTQALARVLQAGVGGMHQAQARQSEKDMGAHLAQSMQGGKYDIPTLLSNPLGRPFAFQLAQQHAEQNTPMAKAKLAAQEQETAQRGELHPYAKSRAEAEAQMAQEQAAAAKDPMRAADRRAGVAEKYLPADARGAYAATGQYSPEPRLTVLPDGSSAVVRNRNTGDYEIVQGGATDPQERFKKEFAKKAPEMYAEASKSYAAAREASNLAADMEAIAPHIISGTWASLETAAKQFVNTYAPGISFKDVAPTQLFISLGQKFVGAEGQKYRPLSNADITFIERGLPNIQKDPSSLPLILKAMQSASDREALYRNMELKALKRGEPPDYDRIVNEVNRLMPSFAQTYGAQLDPGKGRSNPIPPGYSIRPKDGQGAATERGAAPRAAAPEVHSQYRRLVAREFPEDIASMTPQQFVAKYTNPNYLSLLSPEQRQWLYQYSIGQNEGAR